MSGSTVWKRSWPWSYISAIRCAQKPFLCVCVGDCNVIDHAMGPATPASCRTRSMKGLADIVFRQAERDDARALCVVALRSVAVAEPFRQVSGSHWPQRIREAQRDGQSDVIGMFCLRPRGMRKYDT